MGKVYVPLYMSVEVSVCLCESGGVCIVPVEPGGCRCVLMCMSVGVDVGECVCVLRGVCGMDIRGICVYLCLVWGVGRQDRCLCFEIAGILSVKPHVTCCPCPCKLCSPVPTLPAFPFPTASGEAALQSKQQQILLHQVSAAGFACPFSQAMR